MAKTDHVIDDSFVGQAIGPVDGFLVGLRQTQNQSANEVPFWDPGRGVWKSGYLTLRGSNDHQAIFSACPGQGGTVDPSKTWVVNQSLRYHGALIIQAVPRGSIWALTLSDVPVSRTAPASGLWSELRDQILREREVILR